VAGHVIVWKDVDLREADSETGNWDAVDWKDVRVNDDWTPADEHSHLNVPRKRRVRALSISVNYARQWVRNGKVNPGSCNRAVPEY